MGGRGAGSTRWFPFWGRYILVFPGVERPQVAGSKDLAIPWGRKTPGGGVERSWYSLGSNDPRWRGRKILVFPGVERPQVAGSKDPGIPWGRKTPGGGRFWRDPSPFPLPLSPSSPPSPSSLISPPPPQLPPPLPPLFHLIFFPPHPGRGRNEILGPCISLPPRSSSWTLDVGHPGHSRAIQYRFDRREGFGGF